MSPITTDELLAELRRLGVGQIEQGEGLTSRELAKVWNTGRHMVNAHLQKCRDAGILKVNYRTEARIDGRSQRVPCYVITLPEKEAV